MSKNKKKKRILLIIPIIAILIIGWLAFCGYEWSWGPFEVLHHYQTAALVGNDVAYSLENTEVLENSALKGKRMIFLGSSVTYGAASKGVSFADYIAKRNDCIITKEAVSGTTLVDSGIHSYIKRLKKIDEAEADLFVCQLSTNDATQKKALGVVSKSFEMDDFDTSTVAGAMEYIIAYAKSEWNCPVIFYTNPPYDSEAYADMVALLMQMKDKWNITVIDLWSDESFNQITTEEYSLYMADKIHPTQAGYREWWTPYFEQELTKVVLHNESN